MAKRTVVDVERTEERLEADLAVVEAQLKADP